MTFARVATYPIQPGSIDELTRRVNEKLLPLYREQQGFRSLSVVDAGKNVVSISHWDSVEHAKQGGQVAIGWAKEQSDLMTGYASSSHFGSEVVSA